MDFRRVEVVEMDGESEAVEGEDGSEEDGSEEEGREDGWDWWSLMKAFAADGLIAASRVVDVEGVVEEADGTLDGVLVDVGLFEFGFLGRGGGGGERGGHVWVGCRVEGGGGAWHTAAATAF
ncbi:hypothetical protein HDU85_003576 [Gaertneriomyces sp. JEL0708]|nr:hypothetical protein HDU85_003576 [Gaertneriomyces sp. JEL0708]